MKRDTTVQELRFWEKTGDCIHCGSRCRHKGHLHNHINYYHYEVMAVPEVQETERIRQYDHELIKLLVWDANNQEWVSANWRHYLAAGLRNIPRATVKVRNAT